MSQESIRTLRESSGKFLSIIRLAKIIQLAN